MSILFLEGKSAIKEQLYSGPFTLRHASSFFYLSALNQWEEPNFYRFLACVFVHGCIERRLSLSRSAWIDIIVSPRILYYYVDWKLRILDNIRAIQRVDFAYKETTVLILEIAVVFVVIWFFVTALIQRLQLFYVYIFFVLDVWDIRAVNCVVVHTVIHTTNW